jgi:hypothetical protein
MEFGKMINAENLAEAFARNVNIVKMQTNGLTHEDSLIQPPFGGNCLNWVLGHIAENRDRMFELLGEPKLMEESGARYERGSEAITAPDGSTLQLEEILDWLERSQKRMAEALGRNDEVSLSREIAVGNNRTMTLGQRLFFLYFHETYHVGQTELFRQMAGKTDKII